MAGRNDLRCRVGSHRRRKLVKAKDHRWSKIEELRAIGVRIQAQMAIDHGVMVAAHREAIGKLNALRRARRSRQERDRCQREHDGPNCAS